MGDMGRQMGIASKVMHSLQDDLAKEKVQWKVPCYEENPEESGVSRSDRNAAVLWMERQCSRLRFHCDTLCLSVTMLDAFLGQVRAKAKYVTCVALTCLYLAAKICEEDEVVPTVTYVVERVRPGCSAADVLRMERLLLDKLHWQVRLTTPLCFLHSLHCLLVSACPTLLSHRQPRLSSHRQLCGLTDRLLELVTDPRCMPVAPSVLAAALICDQLRRCGLDQTPFVEEARRLVQCSEPELADGQAAVSAVLGETCSVLIPSPAPSPAALAAKRPRQRGDSRSFSRPAKRQLVVVRPDDVVGDIRCLYSGEQEEAKSEPAAKQAERQTEGDAETPLAQTCALVSKVARLSYAEVLRLHLPTPSVAAV